jgi:hypothetical protein
MLKRRAVRSGERVALVAGQGEFAVRVAEALHQAGARVLVIGVERSGANDFSKSADEFLNVGINEGGKALEAAKTRKIRTVVFVGRITKQKIYDSGFKPDEVSGRVIRSAGREKGDHRIMKALSAFLRLQGMRVVGVHELLPGWVMPARVLGRVAPDAAVREDMKLGLEKAKAIGRLDIGQAIAVKNGTVIAVEGIEGTDAMIDRVGSLGIRGAVLAKAAKPQQDLRFDMPVIGIETLHRAARAGFTAVCAEKNRTLLADPVTMIAEADRLGIVLAGA